MRANVFAPLKLSMAKQHSPVTRSLTSAQRIERWQILALNKCHRLLGDVAFPDGRMLNRELVREGVAITRVIFTPLKFCGAQVTAMI